MTGETVHVDPEGFKVVLNRLADAYITLAGLKLQVEEGVFSHGQYETLKSKVQEIAKVAEEVLELIDRRIGLVVEAPSIKKWLKQVEGYE